MNFKKYHVSRNLWDGNKIENCAFQTGIYTTPTYSPRNIIYIPVVGGNTYTFSINNIASGTSFQSVCSADKPALGVSYLINESSTFITHGAVTTFTRTIPKEANWWAIQIMSLDNLSNNIMINEGSTALPYEPYSSEVWHDIPYYQHKTATDTLTLPAVIYPNDTSITVGLKGNEEHTGTPSPQNPVMPNGTGERTGNLWNNGDTWENDDTDTRAFFQPDIALFDGYTKVGDNVRIDVKSNGYKYLVSITPNTSFTRVFVKHNGSTKDLPLGSVYGEFEANVPVTISFIVNGFDPTTIGGISISNIMLNLGSTPLPYEPYGYKIPILLNSQTINKYLGEVQTERQIIKYEFTGKENWIRESGNTYALEGVEQTATGYANTLCTHYILATSYNALIGTDGTFTVSKRPALFIHDENYTSATQLKNYLATQYNNGTPVTIYYTLNTPTTGIINEPLMKIGNYADSLTTSIPCTAGENTLDVQTTVQPSEVTVNYKGWHPVADVHEYDSNYTIATMQALTIAQLQTHTISELQGGEWS